MEFSAAILTLVPVVIGLTEIAKAFVATRFSPVISLVLGVGMAFLLPAATVPSTILSGIVVGLTASGLYAGSKTVIKG